MYFGLQNPSKIEDKPLKNDVRRSFEEKTKKSASQTPIKKPVLARNGKRAKIKYIWPASDQISPKPPAQNLQHLTSSAQPRHLQGSAQPLPSTCPETASQSSYHALWSSAALRAASTTPHCDLRRSGSAQHLPRICPASAQLNLTRNPNKST